MLYDVLYRKKKKDSHSRLTPARGGGQITSGQDPVSYEKKKKKKKEDSHFHRRRQLVALFFPSSPSSSRQRARLEVRVTAPAKCALWKPPAVAQHGAR